MRFNFIDNLKNLVGKVIRVDCFGSPCNENTDIEVFPKKGEERKKMRIAGNHSVLALYTGMVSFKFVETDHNDGFITEYHIGKLNYQK